MKYKTKSKSTSPKEISNKNKQLSKRVINYINNVKAKSK